MEKYTHTDTYKVSSPEVKSTSLLPPRVQFLWEGYEQSTLPARLSSLFPIREGVSELALVSATRSGVRNPTASSHRERGNVTFPSVGIEKLNMLCDPTDLEAMPLCIEGLSSCSTWVHCRKPFQLPYGAVDFANLQKAPTTKKKKSELSSSTTTPTIHKAHEPFFTELFMLSLKGHMLS